MFLLIFCSFTCQYGSSNDYQHHGTIIYSCHFIINFQKMIIFANIQSIRDGVRYVELPFT